MEHIPMWENPGYNCPRDQVTGQEARVVGRRKPAPTPEHEAFMSVWTPPTPQSEEAAAGRGGAGAKGEGGGEGGLMLHTAQGQAFTKEGGMGESSHPDASPLSSLQQLVEWSPEYAEPLPLPSADKPHLPADQTPSAQGSKAKFTETSV